MRKKCLISRSALLGILALASLSVDALAGSSVNPIFRSTRPGDHLFSTDQSEGPRAGYPDPRARYSDEGPKFLLYSTGFLRSHNALFRCLLPSNNTHMLSTDPNCEGQTPEGPLGFLSSEPQVGLVPLIRYRHPTTNEHVSVTNRLRERLEGWIPELPPQGYVLPIDNVDLRDSGVPGSEYEATLSPIQIKGRETGARGVFRGRGVSEGTALENAVARCRSSVDPVSLCSVELGATFSTVKTK